MKPKGIFLNWIVVKDIEIAIKFYTEIMGLTVREFSKEYAWAELSGPEGYLLGIAGENDMCPVKAGSNSIFTITVDDLVASNKELKEKGVRLLGDIVEIPGEVKMQTVLDADGNMLQIVQMLKDVKEEPKKEHNKMHVEHKHTGCYKHK